MLDRIAALMENLKQVSSDIAHDLRTPLTRLRNHLERAGSEAKDQADYVVALNSALAETDEMLALFAALLRIAQIESGSRRAGFAQVDLAALVQPCGRYLSSRGRRCRTRFCARRRGRPRRSRATGNC